LNSNSENKIISDQNYQIKKNLIDFLLALYWILLSFFIIFRKLLLSSLQNPLFAHHAISIEQTYFAQYCTFQNSTSSVTGFFMIIILQIQYECKVRNKLSGKSSRTVQIVFLNRQLLIEVTLYPGASQRGPILGINRCQLLCFVKGLIYFTSSNKWSFF
jgi:hypothetical protein